MHVHVPKTRYEKAAAPVQRLSRWRVGFTHLGDRYDQIAVGDHPLIFAQTIHRIDDGDGFDGHAGGRA